MDVMLPAGFFQLWKNAGLWLAVGYSPRSSENPYKQGWPEGFYGTQPRLPEHSPVPGYLRNGYRIISGTEQNRNTDNSFCTYLRCRAFRWYRWCIVLADLSSDYCRSDCKYRNGRQHSGCCIVPGYLQRCTVHRSLVVNALVLQPWY